jgi:hypothetical protein
MVSFRAARYDPRRHLKPATPIVRIDALGERYAA